MKKKTEKGFALVLSIVLLLVMSLMGGSLIVISAGDHQSNNTSDEYQQTFYVAETALLEAEKLITNKMMGPWIVVADEYAARPVGLNSTEESEWDAMVAALTAEAAAQGGYARDTDKRDLPTNIIPVRGETACYQSFRNLNRAGFLVSEHKYNQNFGTLIQAVFDDTDLDDSASAETLAREEEHMQRFRYEFIIVNIGSAAYKGFGSSLKKTTTTVQTTGTIYKIYGCGYMMPKGTDLTQTRDEFMAVDPDILVPLEGTAVYAN